ncbi:glycosyltransferase [Hyphococcus luteus]|uniref:Glycosyl transferase family 2 n=1 Tax=Hyphococcus luteus TaxID=2058213 RepID=A0A2S7JZ32_9PROT|nr:glycosyltransferase [Marinicaulis flavus]PQA85511.1 glycosyl transferase family 2 [Marinicaulis flavus]
MLTFIAFATLAAWGWLTLLRGDFWRASERLGDPPAPEAWPDIVAVIPARDEAETIGAVIRAHMAADYPGKLTVILADDGSSDGTADIALAAAAGDERALDVVTVPPLPDGWTGKLWAVENGLERAKEIAPDAKYVLLTDADIVLSRDTLARLVSKAEKENLALASLMARLDSRGPWASFLIPAFVYFFQKLYPFPRANDPDDNMAAAAGGCMLARRAAIEAIGGMGAIRTALIDDCTFAKAVKDLTPATRIWIGLARDEAVSLRDNRELSSIWNMVARTAYAQLDYSPLMLAGTALGMALIYLAPPLIILTLFSHWNLAALAYAAGACALMGYTYWPTLRLYGRAPWEAALLPVAAGFYSAMTVSSALRHEQGQGGQWKGRTYSRPGA